MYTVVLELYRMAEAGSWKRKFKLRQDYLSAGDSDKVPTIRISNK